MDYQFVLPTYSDDVLPLF